MVIILKVFEIVSTFFSLTRKGYQFLWLIFIDQSFDHRSYFIKGNILNRTIELFWNFNRYFRSFSKKITVTLNRSGPESYRYRNSSPFASH